MNNFIESRRACRAAATFHSPAKVSGILNHRERSVERDIRRRLVEDDVQVVLPLRALLPLPADERRSAYVRHGIKRTGAGLPGDRTDNRLVVGISDRIAD